MYSTSQLKVRDIPFVNNERRTFMSNTGYIKIQAFELFTPKYLGNSYDVERYDHEQIDYLFEQIKNIPLEQRAFHRKNKVINFTLTHSDDQDFVEGTFSSARYGQVEDIIDVHKQTTQGQKPKDHGLKNEVPFILDKRNGLLLVQKDRNNVVGRDMIHRFFTYHLDLVIPYCEKFNQINDSAQILKRSFVKVGSVPSDEFFNEIENFATIKEAFVVKNVETDKINSEGIEFLANEAKDNDVEDFQQMKISYQNTVRKGHIKHIKAFFKKLHEEDKYDNFGVTGKLESGKDRTLTMAKIPKSYDVKVNVNNNGVPSLSEIIDRMVRVCKYDNPVFNKNEGATSVKKVGDLVDMEEKTQSREDEAGKQGKEIS